MGWRTGLESAVTDWASFGLDLLCPPRCAACRVDLPASAAAAVATVPLCAACGRLLSVDAARCVSCGDPFTGNGDCRCRRGRRADWDGIVVLGGYGEELREAVLRAKQIGRAHV